MLRIILLLLLLTGIVGAGIFYFKAHNLFSPATPGVSTKMEVLNQKDGEVKLKITYTPQKKAVLPSPSAKVSNTSDCQRYNSSPTVCGSLNGCHVEIDSKTKTTLCISVSNSSPIPDADVLPPYFRVANSVSALSSATMLPFKQNGEISWRLDPGSTTVYIEFSFDGKTWQDRTSITQP